MEKKLLLKIIIYTFSFGLFLIPATQIYSALRTNSNSVTTKVGDPKGGKNNFVYYYQYDADWYWTCNKNPDPAKNAMCGPTSLAMIMSTLGVPITPLQVDQAFQAYELRGCGNEPTYYKALFDNFWLRSEGFGNTPLQIPLNLAEVNQFLSDPNTLIFASSQMPLKDGTVLGHIFVIDQVDVNGKRIHVRDPDGPRNPDGYWTDNLNAPWKSAGGLTPPLIYMYAIKRVSQ